VPELVVVLERPLTQRELAVLRKRLGRTVVQEGRELRIESSDVEPQFLVPVVVGILGALGVGIVALIAGSRVWAAAHDIAEFLRDAGPAVAAFMVALVAVYAALRILG